MNDDNSARADEVLRRVRASAGPRPLNEARVLAGLERRLGIAGVMHLPERDAAELARRQGNAAAGRAGRGTSVPPLAGRAATTASIARLARPLGLGAAFGLATGAMGYWWGSQSQASRVDPAVPTLSIPAEAAQPPASLVPAPRQPAPLEAASEPLAGAAPPPGPEAEPTLTRRALNQAAPRRAAPVARPRPRTLASSEVSTSTPSGSENSVSAGAAFTLREAIQQLQRAQTALRRGEALEALELVAQLDRSHPGAMLREERLVTRALALCEMGDLSSAREAVQQLAGDTAQSIYRARLEAGCGLAADEVKKE